MTLLARFIPARASSRALLAIPDLSLRSLRLRWRAAITRHAAAQASAASASRPHRARRVSNPITAECERFIREHERQILNYLWRMTGDEESAYDLTQEVFVRAWQRFDTIRHYEQPRGWLFRVATNLALSHLRRRTIALASAAPTGWDPAASDPAGRQAESDQVRRVLLQLPPKGRAALVLREVYGLSCAEVARTLAMSGPAVRMALHRAREQFRDLYLREEGGH